MPLVTPLLITPLLTTLVICIVMIGYLVFLHNQAKREHVDIEQNEPQYGPHRSY